jgi:hypothetical protein
LFDPRGKVDEGFFEFQRYVHLATRTYLVLSFSSRFSCFTCTARTYAMFSGRFWFLLDVLSGLRSLKLSFSGQQCLQAIRAWASVPRIVFFGPPEPSSYSRLGSSPSNCLLRASRALKLFETGLRSLKFSSSGQKSPQAIRDWAPVPRIVFFGPAEPSNYSRSGFVPSNYFLRAGSALEFFELGLWSLEFFSLGRQCSCLIRVWILVLRIFVS